jgi:hypothetical protein
LLSCKVLKPSCATAWSADAALTLQGTTCCGLLLLLHLCRLLHHRCVILLRLLLPLNCIITAGPLTGCCGPTLLLCFKSAHALC